jgi:4'-phosphopantetheinyl transferase
MTLSTFDWTAPPSPAPPLDSLEVHLWRFSLDAPEPEQVALKALLSTGERQRAKDIRMDAHRRRFEVGHGRLRRVLSSYIGLAPEAIEFGRHSRGKPFIVAAQNPAGVQHNYSNTGNLAIVGVALGRPLGVDVEAHRSDVDMELIARRQFAPGEQARLVSLPAPERPAAFYRCWTRKEAYLKASGDGIAGGLQGFEVSFLPGEPPAIVRAKDGPEECRRWSVIAFDAGPGLSAACVVEGAVSRILCWDLP